MTNVYGISLFDADADDRRGGSTPFTDDYGVWLNKAGAEAKALELNRKLLVGLQRVAVDTYYRELEKWERRRKEYDALYAAGLRDAPFNWPEPEMSTGYHGWAGGRVVDGFKMANYYEVEEFTLNDAQEN